MKKLLPFLYMLSAMLLLVILSGCSSTGYSGGASYHYNNSWEYDNYYRAGVNNYYNRAEVRENVRSEAGTRSRDTGAARAEGAGGAARAGGGGRGGGGRR